MHLSLVSLQTQEGPAFHNKYSTCYALRLQPSTYFTLFYFILVVVCKEVKCFFSTSGCLCHRQTVHEMAFLSLSQLTHIVAHTLSLFLQQQLFPTLSSHNDSFFLPSSVSVPLFHCLFTSHHLPVQHHSSGMELLCLLSASLSHSSS